MGTSRTASGDDTGKTLNPAGPARSRSSWSLSGLRIGKMMPTRRFSADQLIPGGRRRMRDSGADPDGDGSVSADATADADGKHLASPLVSPTFVIGDDSDSTTINLEPELGPAIPTSSASLSTAARDLVRSAIQRSQRHRHSSRSTSESGGSGTGTVIGPSISIGQTSAWAFRPLAQSGRPALPKNADVANFTGSSSPTDPISVPPEISAETEIRAARFASHMTSRQLLWQFLDSLPPAGWQYNPVRTLYNRLERRRLTPLDPGPDAFEDVYTVRRWVGMVTSQAEHRAAGMCRPDEPLPDIRTIGMTGRSARSAAVLAASKADRAGTTTRVRDWTVSPAEMFADIVATQAAGSASGMSDLVDPPVMIELQPVSTYPQETRLSSHSPVLTGTGTSTSLSITLPRRRRHTSDPSTPTTAGPGRSLTDGIVAEPASLPPPSARQSLDDAKMSFATPKGQSPLGSGRLRFGLGQRNIRQQLMLAARNLLGSGANTPTQERGSARHSLDSEPDPATPARVPLPVITPAKSGGSTGSPSVSPEPASIRPTVVTGVVSGEPRMTDPIQPKDRPDRPDRPDSLNLEPVRTTESKVAKLCWEDRYAVWAGRQDQIDDSQSRVADALVMAARIRAQSTCRVLTESKPNRNRSMAVAVSAERATLALRAAGLLDQSAVQFDDRHVGSSQVVAAAAMLQHTIDVVDQTVKTLHHDLHAGLKREIERQVKMTDSVESGLTTSLQTVANLAQNAHTKAGKLGTSVSQLDHRLRSLHRIRNRYRRFARRAGFAVLEKTVVTVMWAIWVVVVAASAVTSLFRLVVTILLWLLWIR